MSVWWRQHSESPDFNLQLLLPWPSKNWVVLVGVGGQDLRSPFQTPEGVSGSAVPCKSEVWAGPEPHAEQRAEAWRAELREAKEAESKGKFRQELVEILWRDKVGDQGICGAVVHPSNCKAPFQDWDPSLLVLKAYDILNLNLNRCRKCRGVYCVLLGLLGHILRLL